MFTYFQKQLITKYLIITLSILISILININLTKKLNAQNINNTQITGTSGGNINSQDCGFISDKPNYTLNLSQKSDYLKVTVNAQGGQPTLLILNSNSQDRFCILGDTNSGINPQFSGIWEAGKYLIFIGDRLNSNHPFTLNISTTK